MWWYFQLIRFWTREKKNMQLEQSYFFVCTVKIPFRLKLWVLKDIGKWAPSWNYPWHFSVSQRNSYAVLRNTRSNKPLQKEWLWPSRAVSLISFCKDSFPLKRGTNKLLRLKLVINLEYKSFHNNSHCNKTNNMS